MVLQGSPSSSSWYSLLSSKTGFYWAAQSKHFEQGKEDNNTHTHPEICNASMHEGTQKAHAHAVTRNAHTCPALNTWQQMKIPTLHLVHTNACTYTQSLLYRQFNITETGVLTHADTWSCIPCSWKVRTRADTRSAPNTAKSWPTLDERQHMQILSQPSILLNHAQPSIWTNTSRFWCSSQSAQTLVADTLSSWYMPTHEDTHSALSRHKLKHALLLIRADTCWNMLCSWYLPTYEDTRPALNMCKHTQTHAQLSIQTNKCRLICSSW
jgi:hypothetical protein